MKAATHVCAAKLVNSDKSWLVSFEAPNGVQYSLGFIDTQAVGDINSDDLIAWISNSKISIALTAQELEKLCLESW